MRRFILRWKYTLGAVAAYLLVCGLVAATFAVAGFAWWAWLLFFGWAALWGVWSGVMVRAEVRKARGTTTSATRAGRDGKRPSASP